MFKPEPTPGKTGWFVHDRFGLFIHWGIYSSAARYEWIKSREKITDEEYQKYFDSFNPDLKEKSPRVKIKKRPVKKKVAKRKVVRKKTEKGE